MRKKLADLLLSSEPDFIDKIGQAEKSRKDFAWSGCE
jgi:hypothetical protein